MSGGPRNWTTAEGVVLTPEQYFWARVDFTPDCWTWAAGQGGGRGVVQWNGQTTFAHRLAYALAYGETPADMVIVHLCGQRLCVRPEHLEAISPAERIVDRTPNSKSFQFKRATHCIHGHEFTEANTRIYRTKSGYGRACRACHQKWLEVPPAERPRRPPSGKAPRPKNDCTRPRPVAGKARPITRKVRVQPQRPRRPTEERLWGYVSKEPDGHWLWTGALVPAGYGRFVVKIDGKWRWKMAHRYVYEHLRGPIPEGLELHHTCEIPACVNPDHLLPVTHRDHNVLYTPHSGPAKNAAKTHCTHGHEFTPENTYEWRGSRYCKKCREARSRRHESARAKNGAR